MGFRLAFSFGVEAGHRANQGVRIFDGNSGVLVNRCQAKKMPLMTVLAEVGLTVEQIRKLLFDDPSVLCCAAKRDNKRWIIDNPAAL